MLPKVVKRGGAARRGGRLTRAALEAQTTPVESDLEESVNIGDLSGSDAIEAKEETTHVDKSFEEENQLDEPNPSNSLDGLEAAMNSDLPRSSSRSEIRRPIVDDPYNPRFERPPSYSEGRSRAYEPLPGSKRPYAALEYILISISSEKNINPTRRERIGGEL